VRKLLPWIIAAIALWMILHNPAGAAADVRHFFAALSSFTSAI
jgi:hypothetical protein